MTQPASGDTSRRLATEARRRLAAARDDPEERYTLASSFYEHRAGDGVDDYGRSELAFMRWEIERGVLNPPQQRSRPGSPWWRAVNERILLDAVEAGLLADAGTGGGSTPAVVLWSEFLRSPSAISWYRAHNSSVLGGYVEACRLAARERPAEQFLMNLVLARVLFAQALAEQAAFAVGGHPLIARFLSDPRLPTVSIAMEVPDFYPRNYPLDEVEEESLERRAHSSEEDLLAVIDAEPCSHLDELFSFASRSLAVPELAKLIDRGLPCYPQGLFPAPDRASASDGGTASGAAEEKARPRVFLPWLATDRHEDSRWTDGFLDRMRHQGDPDADEVVEAYFEESERPGAHHFFRQLVLNPDLPPEEVSPAVAEYLAEQPPLPRWTDPTLVAAGEEFFGRWGLYVPLVLICKSLPECYAAKKGVQVLHLTARLATEPRRRVVETAQMVLDVMSPGGIQPGAPGYQTVRRVRLMHAGVRYLIHNDPRIARGADAGGAGPRWLPGWGVPINQEDLAGTLTTFGWTVLTGLHSLGAVITASEAEAYLHAWNVVGAMLGVREELLPNDATDAEALSERVRARQWGPSPEGEEMARALVDMLDESRPARVFPGFSGTFIRHFVGDECADMLGVPAPHRARSLVRAMSSAATAAGLAGRRSWLLRQGAGVVSRALLRSYATFDRGGSRPSFEIPTQLAGVWSSSRRART